MMRSVTFITNLVGIEDSKFCIILIKIKYKIVPELLSSQRDTMSKRKIKRTEGRKSSRQ